MSTSTLDIVILGLSITSSWSNSHATTFRGLVRELTARGHKVLFLERDKPLHATHRDMPTPPFGRTALYSSLDELKEQYTSAVAQADVVIVGSCVPDGIAVGQWVQQTAQGMTAFYDLDTPVTLSKLERKEYTYIAPSLIPHYNLYLSATGGPALRQLEKYYGSPMARPLYSSFDPDLYYPSTTQKKWDLGYLGTYSSDRQQLLDRIMLEPARHWQQGTFVVAGPQYPTSTQWPVNTERINYLPPSVQREFYNRQRFTLNITRADTLRAGYSPNARLFEAAACATPIISDYWHGLDSFFTLGTEILVANSSQDTLGYLRKMPEEERCRIGERACRKVRSRHTVVHRVAELETFLRESQNSAAFATMFPLRQPVFRYAS